MMWMNRYKLVIDAFDEFNRLALKSLTDEEAGRLFKALMDIDPFPDALKFSIDPEGPADEKLTEAPTGDERWYRLWKRLSRESLKENHNKWKIQFLIRDVAEAAQLHL